MGFFAQAT